MLPLTSRATGRISTSYIRTGCFAPLKYRPLFFYGYYRRSFSSTPWRLVKPPAPEPGTDAVGTQAPTPSQPAHEAPTPSVATPTSNSIDDASKSPSIEQSSIPSNLPEGVIVTLKKILAEESISFAQLKKALGKKPTPKKKKPRNKKDKPEQPEDVLPGTVQSQDVVHSATSKSDKKSSSKKKTSKANRPSASGDSPPPITDAELRDQLLTSIANQDQLVSSVGGSRKDALGKAFGEDIPVSDQAKNESNPAAPTGSSAKALSISRVKSKSLKLVPLGKPRVPVPTLAHGLERVLFNPSVYFLQDPRSRVYNFDPYLAKIMPIKEFDFNALKAYVTSSKDETLISIAKENKKKYTGSTSSMTSMLSHFHYLLSSWRPINSDMLSRQFIPDSVQFTRIMRAPSAIFLNWRDGCYAIDADKEYDSANILSMLGKSMEKLLTLPIQEFERYRHSNSAQISEEERNAEEAFHYTGFRDFMMRSQLDAYDKRVPGTGMFDLKTRAVVSIRMDAKNFQKGLGYEIRKLNGQWESFEREYYDMIRSAFLKYSLQVRMGRMDGIYVAYHNTERIFGFQYVSLPQMDEAIHGSVNTTIGNDEYKFSLYLLNQLLNRATQRWPKKSLRIHLETRKSAVSPFMYMFARPVEEGEIQKVQNAGKKSIEEFERNMLNLNNTADEPYNLETEPSMEIGDDLDNIDDMDDADETTARVAGEQEADSIDLEDEIRSINGLDEPEEQRLKAWEEVREMVEDAIEDEEYGLSSVREVIEDALEQSSLLRMASPAEAREYTDALLAAIIGTDPSLEMSDSPPTLSPVDTPGPILSKNTQPTDDENLPETDTMTQLPSNEPKASDEVDDKNTTTGVINKSMNDFEDVAVQASTDTSSQDETGASSTRLPDEGEYTGEPKADGLSTTSLLPLKTLIVRSAQRISDATVTEQPVESSNDDYSKLQKFERILGQLISRGKAQEQDDVVNTSSSSQSASNDAPQVPGQTSDAMQTSESADDVESQASAGAVGSDGQEPEKQAYEGELLGMVLTIKNKINDKYVERPENMGANHQWEVEYNIEELPDERARKLYMQLLRRRKKVFQEAGNRDSWHSMFGGALARVTKKGKEFRAREDAMAKTHRLHTLDNAASLRNKSGRETKTKKKLPTRKQKRERKEQRTKVQEKRENVDSAGSPPISPDKPNVKN